MAGLQRGDVDVCRNPSRAIGRGARVEMPLEQEYWLAAASAGEWMGFESVQLHSLTLVATSVSEWTRSAGTAERFARHSPALAATRLGALNGAA